MSSVEPETAAPPIEEDAEMVAEVTAMLGGDEAEAQNSGSVEGPAQAAPEQPADAVVVPEPEPAAAPDSQPENKLDATAEEPSTIDAIEATLDQVQADLSHLDATLKQAIPDIPVDLDTPTSDPIDATAATGDIPAVAQPEAAGSPGEATSDSAAEQSAFQTAAATEEAPPEVSPEAMAADAPPTPAAEAVAPERPAETSPETSASTPEATTSPLDTATEPPASKPEANASPLDAELNAIQQPAEAAPEPQAPVPVEAPAPLRPWYHPLRIAHGLAAVLVKTLVLVDFPFGKLSPSVKGMIGCAAIATATIAAAAWVGIVYMRLRAG